jgi:hypothetical protein
MEVRLVTEQQHGRFFAQELMLDQSGNIREQIQDALNVGESQEWHLVGSLTCCPSGV